MLCGKQRTTIIDEESGHGHADTQAVIAAFDKMWLPQSPVITSLRKIGASIT
jgi:hypothetical protein